MELALRSGLRVFTRCSKRIAPPSAGRGMRTSPTRPASRAGTTPSEVVLGGRKVAVQRPRVRADGHEVAPATFQAMAATDPLDRRVVEQMLVGVATRQYARSLEPISARSRESRDEQERVSRRFVARTTAQFAAWQTAPLDALDLVALLIDGVHLGDHCLIVALGIAADGPETRAGRVGRRDRERDRVPRPAGESPESRPPDRSQPPGHPRWLAGPAQGRAGGLRRRRPWSSGAKSTSPATFSTIYRDRERPAGQAMLRRAYQGADVKTAQRALTALARRLETGASECGRERPRRSRRDAHCAHAELFGALATLLATTNAAESLLSRTRHVKRNVKRWRGGQMMLRWVAAGVLEAVKGFRRLKGYADMPKLVAAFRARDQRLGLGVARRTTDRVVVNRAAAEFQQRGGTSP